MGSSANIDHQQLEKRYAAVADLRRRARRRIPRFALDYLEGGVDGEAAIARNRAALDEVQLVPHHIKDGFSPDLTTTLLGTDWSAPFAIAPIGLSGLIWPDMARHFARAARAANIPATLSTVATTSIEDFADEAKENGWFQLYIPDDQTVNADLVKRAKDAGFTTLVVTVDVPVLGRRARDMRNGLTIPPRFTPQAVFQSVMRPAWSLATMRHGLPNFGTLNTYVPAGTRLREAAQYASALARSHVGPAKLEAVRKAWDGPMVVKGILNVEDAKLAKSIGADGVIVSNHGGRQYDAAPDAIALLTPMRKALGMKFPILADGGVTTGLDIARFIASGADFVLVGRAFAYGSAALGEKGPAHTAHILKAELANVMSQLGSPTINDLPATLKSRTV